MNQNLLWKSFKNI